MVTVSVVELDSRKLSSWGLAHQWSCELETLRRGNFCKRVRALSRGGTHNRESSQTGIVPDRGKLSGVQMLKGSQQYGVCVLRLEDRNYEGYKCLSDEGERNICTQACNGTT